MFRRKVKLCENCETGKRTYELDCHTAFCPYLFYYKNKGCLYYKPIKNPEVSKEKISLLKKLISRISSK